jgi:glycine/serine hydroxymethyltransferase
MTPHGVRIGTPAMTTRGMTKESFKGVAELLCDVIELTQGRQASEGTTEGVTESEMNTLKQRVSQLVQGLDYVC